MKLRDGFVTCERGGELVIVATGAAQFAGMVRCNRSASVIVECLRRGATEAGLCDALEKRFDAPREVLARDIHAVLEQLRSIGALDED